MYLFSSFGDVDVSKIGLFILFISVPMLVLAVSSALNKMGNHVGQLGAMPSAGENLPTQAQSNITFSQQVGATHGQDGVIYHQMGEVTYSNTGKVYYDTGKHIYASDASYCVKIGAVTQCTAPITK